MEVELCASVVGCDGYAHRLQGCGLSRTCVILVVAGHSAPDAFLLIVSDYLDSLGLHLDSSDRTSPVNTLACSFDQYDLHCTVFSCFIANSQAR